VYAASARVDVFTEVLVVELPEYRDPPLYKGSPKWVPILPNLCTKEGTRMFRLRFPVVAGCAPTVDKALGTTIKEGAVILLNGSKSYRPAPQHGSPFAAFARFELSSAGVSKPTHILTTACLPAASNHEKRGNVGMWNWSLRCDCYFP